MCGRDKKRQEGGSITVSKYKKASTRQSALEETETSTQVEPLDWSIISKYRNKDSTEGKKKYKKQFANLPSVDHTLDEQGNLRSSSALGGQRSKSDMTLPEFYSLCESVLGIERIRWDSIKTEPANLSA